MTSSDFDYVLGEYEDVKPKLEISRGWNVCLEVPFLRRRLSILDAKQLK